MDVLDTTKSQAMFARAKNVIPGGIYGHYAGNNRRPAPRYFERSEGAHFWDVDGNDYIDYMCAYGPMILGYNHPVVDEAAQAQYRKGNTVSLAAPVIIELAELMVEMVEDADWALFGKNGGDSTGLAVRIARAATGRRKIVKVQDGYHGVVPWMMASTEDVKTSAGTVEEDGAHVLQVPWNDAAAFASLISEHRGDIACFISSPYDHPVLRDNELPEEGYWQQIEQLCRDNDIVLIVDEVRSGFRYNLAGTHVSYGFQPDMVCFGKALGNGYPISALVGSDALKQAATEVFYTGTQFFNAAPMAAAKATLEELARIDGPRVMTELGNTLNDGLVNVAQQQGYELVASGIPAMPYYRLNNVGMDEHFKWVDECVKRGIYLLGYHNHFLSTAHTQADIDRTLEIANEAFIALADRA
jgi:glutamate-1-semialdehyde 2,1-aminomutase